jgi:hypothetical protein
MVVSPRFTRACPAPPPPRRCGEAPRRCGEASRPRGTRLAPRRGRAAASASARARRLRLAPVRAAAAAARRAPAPSRAHWRAAASWHARRAHAAAGAPLRRQQDREVPSEHPPPRQRAGEHRARRAALLGGPGDAGCAPARAASRTRAARAPPPPRPLPAPRHGCAHARCAAPAARNAAARCSRSHARSVCRLRPRGRARSLRHPPRPARQASSCLWSSAAACFRSYAPQPRACRPPEAHTARSASRWEFGG